MTGRLYKATKASLPSSNTTDTGVHLTQLITECVKASIHALKLCQDDLKGHTTRRWRRSERSRRSHLLNLWPLRLKLGLALSKGSSIYGTHRGEVCRLRIGNRLVAENPRNSRRKNKLITGRCIPINIYEGEDEVREKIYSESLKKG